MPFGVRNQDSSRLMHSEEHGTGQGIEFLTWLENNKKQAIIGVTILVGVGFIIFAVKSINEQKENSANQMLFALAPSVGPESEDDASSARDYLKVADEYPGTQAASRAVLLAAAAYFEDEQYDKAEETFSQFIQANRNSDFLNEAELSRAVSLDALGKTTEAITAYEKIIDQKPSQPTSESARLYLGRLKEESGGVEAALKLYDKIIEDALGRQAPFEARQRRDQIYSSHPDLNPENSLEEPVAQFESSSDNDSAQTLISEVVEIPTNAADSQTEEKEAEKTESSTGDKGSEDELPEIDNSSDSETSGDSPE